MRKSHAAQLIADVQHSSQHVEQSHSATFPPLPCAPAHTTSSLARSSEIHEYLFHPCPPMWLLAVSITLRCHAGIPNSGKSSLINALRQASKFGRAKVGGGKALTGATPGLTRHISGFQVPPPAPQEAVFSTLPPCAFSC